MRNKANLGIHVSCLNVVVIIVSLFSSCAGETNIIDGNNKLLCFSVSVPSWKSYADDNASKAETRAEPIAETSFNTSYKFNLYADQYDGSRSYAKLIDNESVSYSNSNSIWQTATPYYWSDTSSKTINFYAYYPTTISNSITHTAGSAPTLTYTVPDDVANQPDIIVANNTGVAGNTMTSTALSFNHIFAAVKFSVGTSGMPTGTITNVTLNNIQYIGTYPLGGTWTPNTTSLKSFSQTVSASNAANTVITSGATTFMMMPQKLNSNASITVTYSGGGTLTKAISGTWEAGKIYTYNVSKTIPVANFDYTGGVQTYTVPLTGTYKLEVWGAQGGMHSASVSDGKGGYSYGNIKLGKDQILYIYVGQKGGDLNYNYYAYNGGGYSYPGGTGGGGATHIANTNRGELSNYAAYQSEVIIVAGGGGGNEPSSGGAGGGTSGGNGTAYNGAYGTGGSQISGGSGGNMGSFGKGGNSYYSGSDSGGSGGGGWYGGGGSTGTAGGGGGGSGHLGTSLLSGTASMSNGAQPGNGYARITFVSAN
jgi:Flp pilus assembly protein TadG